MSETATPVRHPRQEGRARRSVQLRITEIFHSLQGEARTVGRPTVFVRLTGCPLRCVYCDTGYAFHGGELMEIEQIVRRVGTWGTRFVTVTGGEPLAQAGCPEFMRGLCDAGYAVSLETSGAMDISAVDRRVSRVVDIKTPGSGEVHRNLYANLGQLTPHDQLKFVLCDRRDYEWARDLVKGCDLTSRCEVLFSPSHGVLGAATLADWIVGDALPVRFQIQLHKYLWGDVPGR
ncbi:MAG TPA: 7-carboxy-7-deazaguanine synthase QueE [Gammaproteobacteria bacterium]|nr:7-carboxy-7-deazaguanine synthase QueE [Gammaproteobacteria bacterium]